MKYVAYNKKSLAEAVKTLKNGGVIAHPADTCFGLAADLMNRRAIKKTQKIKGRDGSKPMSIMIPVFMKPELSKYAKLDDFALFVCDKLLPGPVTLLLPKGPEIPDYYYPDSPYIGLRIPYDMMTQDILTAFKGSLLTTSANIAGQPPCCDSEEVKAIFKGQKYQPDLIFEGAVQGVCKPSTVILVDKGKIEIKREGPMGRDEIEGILGVNLK